jgi:hypothetical protein
VPRRRHFMPLIFETNETGEAGYTLEPDVALNYGSAPGRPSDRRGRPHPRLPALSGEAGIAVQQIIVVCQFETAGTPDREIGFDGLSHRSTSGQGCAICMSRARSTLA